MIPGGMRHNETATADELELLEVSVPAEMKTVVCDPPPGKLELLSNPLTSHLKTAEKSPGKIADTRLLRRTNRVTLVLCQMCQWPHRPPFWPRDSWTSLHD